MFVDLEGDPFAAEAVGNIYSGFVAPGVDLLYEKNGPSRRRPKSRHLNG